MGLGPNSLLRNAQGLTREDEVGVEDLVPVGLEDARPLGWITVELLCDGRELVAGDDGMLGEAVIRINQRATKNDRHHDFVDLFARSGVEPKDLKGALRRRRYRADRSARSGDDSRAREVTLVAGAVRLERYTEVSDGR